MPGVSYLPRYQVEDYLGWEGDWELWDGVPVSLAPSHDFSHQSIGGNLYSQLRTQLAREECPAECSALYEIDWHIDRNTVVRPDLVVVCERPEGRWIEKRPKLVVEILSPSTRQKDLVAKRELYAANGVPFYLVVDPDDRGTTLLRLEGEDSYAQESAGSSFELHPGCVLRLDLPALFDRT